MVKKLSISIALGALMLMTSCSEDIGLTTKTQAERLTGEKVVATAAMSGMDVRTRAITQTSTQETLDQNGFIMTMYCQTAKNAWQTGDNTSGKILFTKGADGTFTGEGAAWTEAGINDLYAVHSYQNGMYYDQTQKKLVSSDAYPLDSDPVIGHYKGSYRSNVPFDLYHAAAQIRLDVENKSDFDIRVSGELVAFYGYGIPKFQWKEPIDYTMSNGSKVKKLPNDCWFQATDDNFVAASIGTTAGSIKDPFTTAKGVKTLVKTNVIPQIFQGGNVTNPTGVTEYPHEKIRYTIYWQKDGIEQTPIVYERDIDKLQAGVCNLYKLNIEGSRFPQPVLASNVRVDEWSDETVDWTVRPWEAQSHTLTVSSSDANLGKVNVNGVEVTTTSIKVAEGEDATVEAISAAGYKFIKWSDGVTTKKRTVTMGKEDINLTAIFAKHSALYLQTNTAFMVSDEDKLFLESDGHTWTKTITVGSGVTGFVIPTGTGYSDKVYNLDPSNEGHLILKDPTETYTYIPVTEGTWTVTFNDETLEYSITTPATAESVMNEIKSFVTWYDTEIEDFKDIVNVREETTTDIKASMKIAREWIKSNHSLEENQKMLKQLKDDWAKVKTTDITVPLPDPPTVIV